MPADLRAGSSQWNNSKQPCSGAVLHSTQPFFGVAVGMHHGRDQDGLWISLGCMPEWLLSIFFPYTDRCLLSWIWLRPSTDPQVHKLLVVFLFVPALHHHCLHRYYSLAVEDLPLTLNFNYRCAKSRLIQS